MNINVDLSFLPDYLIPIIIDSIDIKPFFIKEFSANSNSNNSQKNNTKVSIYEYPGSIQDFQDIIASILKKNNLDNYVVTQDTEAENTLTILKDGDIQQLGVIVCDFCGAVFHDEDEKYLHQRAHYIF
ncbi:MAG: hypothetical protein ACTHJ7_04115 [Candidatus Nitrosocosmicus sp.]